MSLSLVTLCLALVACGDDSTSEEPEAEESAAAPEPADIRLWLNGPDTPQEIRDWLTTEFEEQNAGSTLTIEEQEWEGLVERLTDQLGGRIELDRRGGARFTILFPET